MHGNVGTAIVNQTSSSERDDVYLPTQEEIQAACAEIQATWTEAERARRLRGQAGRQRNVTVTAKRFARLSVDRTGRDGWAA
ncbi:hypothetical protein SH668x_000306 [Planctomicrobium sp. SH668]|uniref:hypothetical protein n=1 Tax=Planctomicrobium sp. SH668 TaxID=3448126 RepID=UPI003F5B1BB6